MSEYDICILGAGISGLYCARELARALPGSKICILEKYKYIGGRISTFKTNVNGQGEVKWEAGAGRLHNSHHKLLKLLKEYDIDISPIHGIIQWYSSGSYYPIEFGRYIENISAIKSLPDETIKSHTLKGLLDLTIGTSSAKVLMDTYEYKSELDTLRADKALEALSNELGYQSGFSIVNKGLSSLIGALKRDIEKIGVKIFREHEVDDIIMDNSLYRIIIKGKKMCKSFRASNVIVTLPRDAVSKLPCFAKLPVLKQVKMRPLVRMYAVFPLHEGKPWFDGLGKIVCKSPIHYIIPIDATRGIIMISYTDGKDAEYWINIYENPNGVSKIQNEVMSRLRALFSHIEIPDPLAFEIHPWSDGCSYWLPGNYDIDKVSMSSIIPIPDEMPNVYMTNESWATNQSWIESSLDQADKTLSVILGKRARG